MITIRYLQEQLTGELQGDVIVKQWNYDTDDFDFVTPLDEIPGTSPIMDRPIKYMCADTVTRKNSLGDQVREPVLFIEVEGDFD